MKKQHVGAINSLPPNKILIVIQEGHYKYSSFGVRGVYHSYNINIKNSLLNVSGFITILAKTSHIDIVALKFFSFAFHYCI